MKTHLVAAVAAICVWSAGTLGIQAADPAGQEPIEITLQYGMTTGDLVVLPNKLQLEKGKPYKLVITNPSDMTHYVSALQFAAAVKTRKIEVAGGEVKGNKVYAGRASLRRQAPNTYSFRLKEIEIRPGGTAEWLFVPSKAGNFKLECGIPAHAEAGMVGEISVI